MNVKQANVPRPLGLSAVLLTSITICLWGGNPVAMKYSLSGFPPIAIAALRFGIAALFMIGWCAASKSPLGLQRGQRIPALITGFLLFAQISLFNLGVSRTSTSHTTVLINTFIFWVVIIEHFVTRNHRLSWRSVAGLLLAASGVLMLIGTSESAASAEQRDSTSIVGDIILFASAFLLGLKIVYTKRAVRVVPPGTLILWHDVIGVAMFVCLSGLTEYDRAWTPDWPSCLGLVYQGLFVAGVCFALQAVLLRKYSASQISVFSFATPLVGVALSVLLRGDQLSPWLLTSGTVVACGILLVNLPNRKQKKLE